MDNMEMLNLAQAVSVECVSMKELNEYEIKKINTTPFKQRFLNLFRNKEHKKHTFSEIVCSVYHFRFADDSYTINEFLKYYPSRLIKNNKVYLKPKVKLNLSDGTSRIRVFDNEAVARNFYKMINKYAHENGITLINFSTMQVN